MNPNKIFILGPGLAIALSNYEQTELFLKYGANPKLKFNHQWSRSHHCYTTPYKIAKEKGLTDIVELMDQYIN